MSTLVNVITDLEALFQKFNLYWFEGKLEKPVITVSPDTTKGAYGWCTTWKAWQDGTQGGYYEINLCAEHLNREFTDIANTLLHEMVHLYNVTHGVKDCSRGGTYHNAKFKTACEQFGLTASIMGQYGWAKTELTEESKRVTQEFQNEMNKTGFSLVRQTPDKAKKAKKSSSIKYVCPECGNIIRATKQVRVICADCDVEYQEA